MYVIEFEADVHNNMNYMTAKTFHLLIPIFTSTLCTNFILQMITHYY
jgi:hypothetical protein